MDWQNTTFDEFLASLQEVTFLSHFSLQGCTTHGYPTIKDLRSWDILPHGASTDLLYCCRWTGPCRQEA